MENTKKYLFSLTMAAIILVGLLLRLKGLLINPSMWHDECGLAFNVINKNYSEFFGILRLNQMAPPLFMVATKFLVNLFSATKNPATCDLVMRLIPFCCSVLSIGLFYLICREAFKTKFAIISAMLLFSINNELINYSFEFKPYSVDLFLILLAILIFSKLDLDKISYKKLAAYATGIALFIWFSFTSAFAIGAGLINLLKSRKNFKKIAVLGTPFFISTLIYLFFYVLKIYAGNKGVMTNFWGNEFINANLSNFLPLLVENLRYFFFPAGAILFVLILIVYGIVILYREKQYDLTNLILLTFAILIAASVFHIYPFSKRLILFLIPLFLILMVKPVDKLNWYGIGGKIKSFIIAAMFLSILIPQLTFAFTRINIQPINKGEFPREMMAYMAQNIKPDDVIFVNNASKWEYLYYSSFYNIKNGLILENLSNTPDEKYSTLLNNLSKGKYWFYLPYDYTHLEIINFVKDWAKRNTKIIYTMEATQSSLIYAEVE